MELEGLATERTVQLARVMRFAWLLALAACTESPTETGNVTGGVGGKADGAAVTITFDRGWNEVASGALVAGEQVQISYDIDRLKQCRSSTHGSEAWGITGFVKFDDGTVQSFALTELADHTVHGVPATFTMKGQRMELWFQNSDVFGCVAYDSNFNANYVFDLQTAPQGESPVVSFELDWSETQSGPIHAGDALVVHYDPQRLSRCSGSTHGHAGWAVSGYYQVDNGAVHSFQASVADGGTLLPSDAAITVSGGQDLALWFEATSIWGCHEYDSNFGANYHFAIE